MAASASWHAAIWLSKNRLKLKIGSFEYITVLYELPLCISAAVLRCRAPDHALQQDGRNTRNPQERITTSAILKFAKPQGSMGNFLTVPSLPGRILPPGMGGNNFAIYFRSWQLKHNFRNLNKESNLRQILHS